MNTWDRVVKVVCHCVPVPSRGFIEPLVQFLWYCTFIGLVSNGIVSTGQPMLGICSCSRLFPRKETTWFTEGRSWQPPSCLLVLMQERQRESAGGRESSRTQELGCRLGEKITADGETACLFPFLSCVDVCVEHGRKPPTALGRRKPGGVSVGSVLPACLSHRVVSITYVWHEMTVLSPRELPSSA